MQLPERLVDIEKLMRSSKSGLFRNMPGFVIRILGKIIRQDVINTSYDQSRHLEGIAFIDNMLKIWGIDVIIKGEENLPRDGRFVIVANHPVGAIDALSIFSASAKYFSDLVSPSNELLGAIPNIHDQMLGINVFGQNTKETITKLNALFESDRQIIIFPAGEVSRKKKGVISDPLWQKTFITKAVQFKRDIIPVFISGRNSELFYRTANLRSFLGIKMYIETILLPREMISQRNKPVTLTFGKPIPYSSISEEMTHQEWAQKIKAIVYELGRED